MKITDPDVIKNGEKDLIDAVKDDLDLDTIKEIMQNKMNAKTISSKGGEIVVHNNEIAFRLDFNIEISGSLMFDRQGNYIPNSEEIGDMNDPLSQDIEMSDLDIEKTLEQVGPNADEPDANEFDEQEEIESIDDSLEDEDFNINLPDYSLDDDDDETVEPDIVEPNQKESDQDDDLLKLDELISEEDSQQMIEDDLDTLDPDGELDLADELDLPEKSDPDEIDTTEESDALDETQTADLEDDNLIDDDISDILKESRDFWEQKKES